MSFGDELIVIIFLSSQLLRENISRFWWYCFETLCDIKLYFHVILSGERARLVECGPARTPFMLQIRFHRGISFPV